MTKVAVAYLMRLVYRFFAFSNSFLSKLFLSQSFVIPERELSLADVHVFYKFPFRDDKSCCGSFAVY